MDAVTLAVKDADWLALCDAVWLMLRLWDRVLACVRELVCERVPVLLLLCVWLGVRVARRSASAMLSMRSYCSGSCSGSGFERRSECASATA